MILSKEQLAPVLNHIKSNYRRRLMEGGILALIGAIGVYYGSNNEAIFLYAGAFGLLAGLFLVLLAFRNPSNHKLVKWLNESPEKIVWMYEVKGSRSNGIRIFREDGSHVFLEITGPNKANLLNYFHKLLPDAHFGYDEVGKARVKKK